MSTNKLKKEIGMPFEYVVFVKAQIGALKKCIFGNMTILKLIIAMDYIDIPAKIQLN